jgi:hypothetical protein
MFLYSVIVVVVVALASAALVYVLKLYKSLNRSVLLAMAGSTIVAGILFPWVWNSLMNWSADTAAPFPLSILGAFLMTLLLYLTLLLILTVLISSFINEKNMNGIKKKINESIAGKAFNKTHSRYATYIESRKQQVGDRNPSHLHFGERKPLEEKTETLPETASLAEVAFSSEDTVEGKNILEKSVDTGKNLDTMGVEYCNSIGEILDEKLQKQQNEQEELQQIAYSGSDMAEAVEKTAEWNEILESQKLMEPVTDVAMETAAATVEQDLPLYDTYMVETASGEITIEIEPDLTTSSQEEVAFSVFTESLSESAEMTATAADVNTMTGMEPEAGVKYFIDEVFSLKQGGDLEGALLCYMEALDRQLDEELVFWIIVDICVIYKTLGQVELARDVLQSYMSRYGHIMSNAVRQEIEQNL